MDIPVGLVDTPVSDESKQGLGPLAGFVVADFSRVLAGPYCSMLLADLGATVIKVEAPDGDDTRNWVPPHRDGVSTYYMAVNRNKQSIILDLTDPTDLQTAYDIIEQSDVFLENFKPGGLKKFGLDPESVAGRWPHVVHASITGFGTAQGASLPGYDLLAQALSGFMSVTGYADGPPQRAGVAIFDVVTGLHAAVGILAALHEKDESQRGQHVELDLLSSALSGLVNQTQGVIATDSNPPRMGNDHPSLFPYGPFIAADRELIICCGNDNQFKRLTTALGIPNVGHNPMFLTMKGRNANRDELRSLLEQALAKATAEEWFGILRAQGIPCSPILTVREGVEFADSLGLNPVVEAGSGDSATPTVRHPVRFSRSSITYDKAPPTTGADGDDVREWIQCRSREQSVASSMGQSPQGPPSSQ